MLGTSKDIHMKITAYRVVAKMASITIHNLPFSNTYDHNEGIKSGNLYSYQMEHLPIEAQIILAEHQLNKARDCILSWRKKDTESRINTLVGTNDRERYSIFKNAPEYLGTQMYAVLKVFAQIDRSTAKEWLRLNRNYKLDISQIERNYPNKTGCYKKRMAALTPVLVQYLDLADQYIANLLLHYKS